MRTNAARQTFTGHPITLEIHEHHAGLVERTLTVGAMLVLVIGCWWLIAVEIPRFVTRMLLPAHVVVAAEHELARVRRGQ